MGAHVWGPAYLRDHLLPELRVSGWSPDWYAGFPAYHFYMVVPALAVVALDVGLAAGWAALGMLAAAVAIAAAAWRTPRGLRRWGLFAAAVAVLAMGVDLPYGTAFKLVSVAGLISLPACTYLAMRLGGLAFPVPMLGAVAAVAFVFNRDFTIYGGNAASTLAGEFSFSISLSFAVLYLGVLSAGLRTGRHRAWAALLLAMTGLCHVIPAIWVLGATAVAVAFHRRRATLVWLAGVVPTGGLLAAWWLLPFVGQRAYVNDMGWEKIPYRVAGNDGGALARTLFSFDGETFWRYLVPRGGAVPAGVPIGPFADDMTWIVALAVLGAAVAVVRRLGFARWVAVVTVATAVAFVALPQGRLWNARVLPFYYLGLYLLAAVGVAEVIRLVSVGVARRRSVAGLAVGIGAPALTAAVVLALVGLGLGYLPLGERHLDGSYSWLGLEARQTSFVRSWASWNYSGYEAKPAYGEYRDLITTMGDVGRREGCGRAMWEYDSDLNRYGTPMALMLLPHWTDGCIASMEGLYFESSETTPYHFLVQAEVSAAPSSAQRCLPYTGFDLDAGIAHLRLLGVRYYLASSTQATTAATGRDDLREVARSGPWTVYEVLDSELVAPLARTPVVLEDLHDDHHGWIGDPSDRPCRGPGVTWFGDASRRGTLVAADGPSDGDPGGSWPRSTVAGAAAAGGRPVEPVAVSRIRAGDDRMSFDVSDVGRPVLVKASWFPNWRVEGAEGPYRVAPNLMVVVPTSTHVEAPLRPRADRVGVVPADASGGSRHGGPGPATAGAGARPPARPVPAVRRFPARPGLVFAAVAALPTAVDVGLLVALRQAASVALVPADAAAVALASGVSYLAHSQISLRSDPYVRWVRMPLAFVAVALAAGAVDLVVLSALDAGLGGGGTAALVAAKAGALVAAAVVRGFAYRAVLLTVVRAGRERGPARPPAPGAIRASIVIPAYDEAGRIGSTVASLRAGLAPWGAAPPDRGGIEILVVDDGSRDDTAGVALASGADQVVVLPANRGKGAAVRTGVLAARGRTVVFTDADLAYGVSQVGSIIDTVESGWDMVIGRRGGSTARTRGSRVRGWGSRAVNLAAAMVLLSRPCDTQCGLKGFRADAAATVFALAQIDGFAFDIELLHLAERHGLSVGEMAVEVVHDGRSSVRVVPDTARLLVDLIRIRRLGATGAYEPRAPARALRGGSGGGN